MQDEPDVSGIAGRMKRLCIMPVQRFVSAQTGVGASQIASEFLLAKLVLIGKAVIRGIPIATPNGLHEVFNRGLRRRS
jgi:hypothetical protein